MATVKISELNSGDNTQRAGTFIPAVQNGETVKLPADNNDVADIAKLRLLSGCGSALAIPNNSDVVTYIYYDNNNFLDQKGGQGNPAWFTDSGGIHWSYMLVENNNYTGIPADYDTRSFGFISSIYYNPDSGSWSLILRLNGTDVNGNVKQWIWNNLFGYWQDAESSDFQEKINTNSADDITNILLTSNSNISVLTNPTSTGGQPVKEIVAKTHKTNYAVNGRSNYADLMPRLLHDVDVNPEMFGVLVPSGTTTLTMQFSELFFSFMSLAGKPFYVCDNRTSNLQLDVQAINGGSKNSTAYIRFVNHATPIDISFVSNWQNNNTTTWKNNIKSLRIIGDCTVKISIIPAPYKYFKSVPAQTGTIQTASSDVITVAMEVVDGQSALNEIYQRMGWRKALTLEYDSTSNIRYNNVSFYNIFNNGTIGDYSLTMVDRTHIIADINTCTYIMIRYIDVNSNNMFVAILQLDDIKNNVYLLIASTGSGYTTSIYDINYQFNIGTQANGILDLLFA
jgi:hypothetical protein